MPWPAGQRSERKNIRRLESSTSGVEHVDKHESEHKVWKFLCHILFTREHLPWKKH